MHNPYMRHILPILFVFLVTPQVLAEEKTTELLSDFELGRYQYCGDDSDCMQAINGCCDCANGGVDVAVNKLRYEDFRARFNCLEVECGKNDANSSCGNGVVSCINHKCKYIPKKVFD